MSDRLEWFTVTIPAGTPISSPQVTPLVFNYGDVVEIDIKVPPGPGGNVGFFIGAGGSQYVPRTVGSYIIPDDDYFTWAMDNAVNSGSWSITAYNTDIYDHTIQVGFQVNEIGNAHITPSSAPATSTDLLNSAVAIAAPDTSASIDPLSPDALLASINAASALPDDLSLV